MKKRGRYMQRKAQVSIFMLLAIVILLLGSLYFFYQREFAEDEVEFVEPEIVPLKSYIEDCLKTIADDGIEIIGLTGGYIDVPNGISSDPRRYIATFPGSGFKIPYWWFKGIESVPSEDFIKQQLKNHIENELDGCINNFEPFSSQFAIKVLKKPEAEVELNDEDTFFRLNYKLDVADKDGNFNSKIEKFGYSMPIRFKKVYELAKTMMERENKDGFVERRTIDLYALDPDIPTTDLDVTCKTKTWQLSKINDILKESLRINLPYIRVKGTDYNPNLYVPNPRGEDIYSKTYFQNHFVWEVDTEAEKKYSNMKVAFTYDNWPIKLYARPSENGILKSNSRKGNEMINFFCLHLWHFTYDIEYPLLVTIIDQETPKNSRYQFNFAFKVDIDHNQPNRINKGSTLFETFDDVGSEEFCNNAENEVTIFTVDNATGEDLKDINLTFVCGRFYCDMGKSDWLSLGAAAGITKRFPYCVNGIIKGKGEGFADSQSFMQTDVDGRSYVLFMDPVKEFKNYKVVKHLISDPGTALELDPNEKASIFIKSNETGFESFAFYPREADFPFKISAGKDITYEVSVYLVDDQDLIGGYIGSWKINKEDLFDKNEVIFHVVYQGAATDEDRSKFVVELESHSENVPKPELK